MSRLTSRLAPPNFTEKILHYAMEANKYPSFKVYLYQPNGAEPEIRRFQMQVPMLTYDIFRNKLVEIFPLLSEKKFCIYWKDEEGDEVAVSSLLELSLAVRSMTGDVLKFLVKVQGVLAEKKNLAFHPNIFCDGCDREIVGVRYKCLLCHDYDLCESCDKSDIHGEHPMLKIPNPSIFKNVNLDKISHSVRSILSKDKHRERKHYHDVHCTDDNYQTSSNSHKHKKCGRRDSGPDTGDDSEEGCHKKHSYSHKKLRKGKCPYSQVMSDVFTYLSPKYYQSWADETKEEPQGESSRAKYLRSVGMKLQKFLDPLGVEVDFEVRPNGEQNGGQKQEKKEEKKDGKQADAEEERPSQPTPSPSQKEVRFLSEEWARHTMDDIVDLLAKHSVNESGKNGNGKNGNDDWVQFEELEKDAEDTPKGASGSTGAIPKTPQEEEKTSEKEEKTPKSSSKAPEQTNLYPNLNAREGSADPKVRTALEQMLSMGFTNEFNWLGRLLEAKDGDINRALEVLDRRGKNSNPI